MRCINLATVVVDQTELELQSGYSSKNASYFTERGAARGHSFTYYIRTYGCQLNESDSEKLKGILNGMSLTSSHSEDADILIFNTCSIRENAQDRLFGNLGLVKAMKKKNPDMVVAVCGCMMKQDENVQKIRQSYPYVDIIFGPADIHRLPALLHDYLFNHKKVYQVSQTDYIVDDLDIPIDRTRRFRALVPINYGCDNFCTYCIVPYTRGRERSRPFDLIMQEIHSLASAGYKEIMLLGQNVNSYGKDLADKPRFVDLLKAAASVNRIEVLRFMTSHPKDLSDEVIEVMAEYPVIETHLHLPLQSGSNRILQAMNRHYTREQYIRTAKRFRERVPSGTVSTDIIVGFPGESENDFLDTLSVMEEIRFDFAYTFMYSIRPGTPAATMDNQIPQEIVSERFSRLLALQNEHAFASNQSLCGKYERVLIEGRSETAPDILTGRTHSNRLVNFHIPVHSIMPDGHALREDEAIDGSLFEGKVAEILIQRARPYSVEGRLEKFIHDGK